MITQIELQEQLYYDSISGVFTWVVSKGKVKVGDIAGSITHKYIQIKLNYINYRAHRLAWLYVHGSLPKNGLDHINGIRDDNRMSNLREATNAENNQNKTKPQSNSTTGFLGVDRHKQSRKWRASIRINGKTKHIGYFNTAEEASSAYIAEKRLLHIFCTI